MADDYRALLKQFKERTPEAATGLPAGFYTDPDWTSVEVSELFHRDWVCVGRADEIPNKGDYFSFDLAGEPIVVAHGRDGSIRALSNVCRHRGALVAEGSGNTRAFLCPYHHWSYDTTGKLIAAPRIKNSEAFDTRTCRLPEFHCETWNGFLFVSLAETPPDLAETLSPLGEMIGAYHLEDMRTRYLTEEVWDTNWKCLTENFMEGYHLSPLHRTTLHTVNPTELCRRLPPGGAYFGYSVGFTARVPDDKIGHPDLSEEQLNTCIMLAVPPGLCIGIGSDYGSFLCIRPEGPGRVRTKIGLIFFGENWEDSVIDEAIALFQATMAEDKSILVGLQRGLASRHHVPGPLAPPDFEGTIFDFHQFLAQRLAGS